MNSTEPRVYALSPGGLDKLKSKIEILNRRAVKMGFPVIVISAKVTTKEIAKRDAYGPVFETVDGKTAPVLISVEGFDVTVTGESPKFGGWSFAAAITHGETGNTIRNISGGDLPVRFRTAASNCDHCHTTRRRNDTYVVLHEDGQYQQVGKQCLKDFTGHASPAALASWLEIIANLEDECGSLEDEDCEGKFGRGERRIGTDHLLAFAAMWIRKNGFVSRKQAEAWDKSSTGSSVFLCLTDRLCWDSFAKSGAIHPISEADTATAQSIRVWVSTFPASCNEYLHNLKVTLSAESLSFRSAGLAVSSVASYQRHIGEIEERKKAVANAPEQPYVGRIGERLRDLKVTCTFIRAIEGDYGVTTFCRFQDAEGRVYKWKASGDPTISRDRHNKDLEIGDEVSITGTVKDQGPDTYNHDRLTNTLSRCKLELLAMVREKVGRGRL